MKYEVYQHHFIEKANHSGYSEENIQRCLRYAKQLIEKGLPVIYNLDHFSALVGYNSLYILRAIVHTPYFYRYFEVEKNNGKKRKISEPLPSLKEIQTWILNHVLYKVEVSRFAKAYLPNTTLKQHLVFHKNQNMVLTLDIENFFSSIKLSQIIDLYKNLGFSASLSNLLGKICCLNDSLPQGAATSPYLSNIFLKQFDEKIGAFCLSRKIRFSRYADDIAFSGDFDPAELKIIVSKELDALGGLKLNKEKTKLMLSSQQQIITGVVVNKKLQVKRQERNELRQILFYIKKFGLEDHMRRAKIENSNYLLHLLGKINFILFMNPDDREFLNYKEILIKIKKG